jgi:hypothetical protein
LKKLLHNHFITEKMLEKRCGKAKDSVIFALFFYFIRELNIYSPLVSISQIINQLNTKKTMAPQI